MELACIYCFMKKSMFAWTSFCMFDDAMTRKIHMAETRYGGTFKNENNERKIKFLPMP